MCHVMLINMQVGLRCRPISDRLDTELLIITIEIEVQIKDKDSTSVLFCTLNSYCSHLLVTVVLYKSHVQIFRLSLEQFL